MSVDKVLSRICDAPSEEAAYEAQQMLKTIYHRLRSRGKVEQSYDLLSQGAQAQLRRERWASGSELGSLLVDAYAQDGCRAGHAEVQRVIDVLSSFPKSPSQAVSAHAKASVVEASRVGAAAIRWARKQGNSEACRRLHDLLALQASGVLTGARGLAASAEHFARGADMQASARAILDAAKHEGAECDLDLFAARAVLQLLAASSRDEQGVQLQHAGELLGALQKGFLRSEPGTSEQPFAAFLPMLLQALHARSLPLVELLEREYASSLSRDGHLLELLQAVKQAYLGMQQPGMGGLLGSLFSRMLSAEEEQPA